MLLTQHVNRSKVSWTPRFPLARLSFGTPAALGVQISSASHGETRSNGPSIPATFASARTQTKYSLFPPIKKANAVYGGWVGGGGIEKASVAKPTFAISRLIANVPGPEFLGTSSLVSVACWLKTGAEEISWAFGAAFLKAPSTRKDCADMWRSGNAPSLAPSCGHPLY